MAIKTQFPINLIPVRLQVARLRKGLPSIMIAGQYLVNMRVVGSPRTYRAYEKGSRGLPAVVATRIEQALETRQGWLHEGGGETLEELKAEAEQRQIALNEAARQSRPFHRQTLGSAIIRPQINQLSAIPSHLDVIPSQLVVAPTIPFLLAIEIADFLAGQKGPSMRKRSLPVPDEYAGGTFYAYEIEPSDISMVSAQGDSFRPGAILIMNASSASWLEISPPFYALVRAKRMMGWLFRRIDASVPLSIATEYTLRALNPDIAPQRVTNPKDWQIGGRLFADLRRY